MTAEEEQLIFKDICARIPYGLIVHSLGLPHEQKLVGYIPDIEEYNIKPYLRTMSSMTEEEKKEFQACHCIYELHPDFQPMMCNLANELNMFDWLNANHFNYRLPPHLFIEAPEGMYKK